MVCYGSTSLDIFKKIESHVQRYFNDYNNIRLGSFAIQRKNCEDAATEIFLRRPADKSKMKRVTNNRISEISNVNRTIIEDIKSIQLVWFGPGP